MTQLTQKKITETYNLAELQELLNKEKYSDKIFNKHYAELVKSILREKKLGNINNVSLCKDDILYLTRELNKTNNKINLIKERIKLLTNNIKL